MTLDLSPADSRGRPIKFTPERLEQIKNLVERGHTRDQIAEIIGVTVGSLAVTCSRVGLSLRRPKLDNGIWPNERKSMNNDEPKPTNGPKRQYTLKLEYNGRSISVPLDAGTVVALVLEAEFRDMRVADLLEQIVRDFSPATRGFEIAMS